MSVEKNKKSQDNELKTYTQISENNDWEGEEWNFFLDNNDPLTSKVVELTNKLSQDDEYSEVFKVVEKNVSEQTVKTLLKKKSVATYMNDYNLVKTISPEVLELSNLSTDDLSDKFYKGKLFKCS